MLEFFATLHWGAVIQIIVIDMLLGGDNAVVIALACRNLPAQQRARGILWGTVLFKELHRSGWSRKVGVIGGGGR